MSLEEERMTKEKKIKEQMLALEAEKLAKEREDAARTIMFMNPSSLNDKARAYWEIAHAKILARESGSAVVVVLVVVVVFEVAAMVVASTTYTCY